MRVSVVGIQNADGANDVYKQMCKKADEVRHSSKPIGELPTPLPRKNDEQGGQGGGAKATQVGE